MHLCSFNGCFYWMFFNSIKEIHRLKEETDRLLDDDDDDDDDEFLGG